MIAIFRREIISFFSSPIAYLVLGMFLLFNGLFLWVFRGEFNILDYGFAELSNFFLLAPWIFLFLIPAVTMKSFSEERRLGTIELLFIKPLSLLQILVGKYLAAVSLLAIALLPTLLYAFSVYQLGAPAGNIDLGVTLGAYLGLLFLIGCYTAIGIFASTLTENQIVAFISGFSLCFGLYYGFDALSSIPGQGETILLVRQLGIKAHVENLAQGILDTRDMVYLLSVAFFFLFLAYRQLKNIRH